MNTPTLSAFLRARISEDAARVAWWPTPDPIGVAPDGHPWRDADGHFIYPPRDHALVECESKRRIVEWCTEPGADQIQCEMVLQLLALPYAGHPNYDESWRP